MATIPNYRQIVDQVYATGQFNLTTLQGCGNFTRAVAVPVHKADARFVMLKKKASRTHVVDNKGRLHGADVLLFVDGAKAIAIDIIGSSASPDAKPSWGPEKDPKTKQLIYRYAPADGFAPDYATEPTPDPGPEPSDQAERDRRLFAKLDQIVALINEIRALR